jgi:site-specific DNA-methyltransferase (adenine-specific)
LENKLILGDCIIKMQNIPDGSVDMVLADFPYGITRNRWDSVLPLDKVWDLFNKKVKPNGAVVLFGQDKFSAKLMLSNERDHRYNLVWKKGERTSGFLNANRMPLRNHEDILVFYKKLPVFNPQFTIGKALHGKGVSYLTAETTNNNYGEFEQKEDYRKVSTQKYPKSLLEFDYLEEEFEMLLNHSVLNFERPHPPIHPTQKPIALLEWLIKTYTNENDLVLDNTTGVGSTRRAAKNISRRYIGIEKEKKYYDIAVEQLR